MDSVFCLAPIGWPDSAELTNQPVHQNLHLQKEIEKRTEEVVQPLINKVENHMALNQSDSLNQISTSSDNVQSKESLLVQRILKVPNSTLSANLIYYYGYTLMEFIQLKCLELRSEHESLKKWIPLEALLDLEEEDKLEFFIGNLKELFAVVKDEQLANKQLTIPKIVLEDLKSIYLLLNQEAIHFTEIYKIIGMGNRQFISDFFNKFKELKEYFTQFAVQIPKMLNLYKSYVKQVLVSIKSQRLRPELEKMIPSHFYGKKEFDELIQCLQALEIIYRDKMKAIDKHVKSIQAANINQISNQLDVFNTCLDTYYSQSQGKVVTALTCVDFFLTSAQKLEKSFKSSNSNLIDKEIVIPILYYEMLDYPKLSGYLLEFGQANVVLLRLLMRQSKKMNLIFQMSVARQNAHKQSWPLKEVDSIISEFGKIDHQYSHPIQKKKVSKAYHQKQEKEETRKPQGNAFRPEQFFRAKPSMSFAEMRQKQVLDGLSALISKMQEPSVSGVVIEQGLSLISEAVCLMNPIAQKVLAIWRDSIKGLSEDLTERFKRSQHDMRDHLFMGLCGFDIFVQAVMKKDFKALPSIFPMLILDWHMQIEPTEDMHYMAKHQKEVGHCHDIVEIAKSNERWKTLSKSLQKHYNNHHAGLLWSRYAASSQLRYSSKKLPAALKMLNLATSIFQEKGQDSQYSLENIERIKHIISYVIHAQKASFELFEQSLLPDQDSSSAQELLQMSQQFLQSLEPKLYAQLETPLLTETVDSQEMPQAKEIAEIEQFFALKIQEVESNYSLLSELSQGKDERILHHFYDAKSQLIRLQMTPHLMTSYSQSYLASWHYRNVFNVLWALEGFYLSHCLVKGMNIEKNYHDLMDFQTRLSDENHPQFNALLNLFNLGKGFHYSRSFKKTYDSSPLIQNLLNLIDGAMHSMELGNYSTQKAVNESALANEILSLLKMSQPLVQEVFQDLITTCESSNKNNNEFI